MRRLRHFLQVFVFVGMVVASMGKPTKEASLEIDALLARIETNDEIVFIRNGSEFSGKDAAAHLRLKLGKSEDRVTTAEDFISICASKSSASGKNYLVRSGSKDPEEAGAYFSRILKEIRSK